VRLVSLPPLAQAVVPVPGVVLRAPTDTGQVFVGFGHDGSSGVGGQGRRIYAGMRIYAGILRTSSL